MDSTAIYAFGEPRVIAARHSDFGARAFGPHIHDAFSVGLVLDGRANVMIDDDVHAVGKGTVVVIGPRVKHACNPQPGSRWAYYMFYFDEVWFGQIAAEVAGAADGGTIPRDGLLRDRNLRGLLESLFRAVRDGRPALEVEELVYGVAEGIAGAEGRAAEVPRGRTSNRKIEAARAFMAERLEKNLSIDDIAAAAGLSPYHFLRAFRESTGLTPHKYLLVLKVNRSKELLEGGASAAEAAHRLGFADQSHFSRIFRECAGVPPGRYLKALRRPGQPD